MKPKLTTRKFYNKWLYKVTLRMPGVAILRICKINEVPGFVFPAILRPTSTLAKAQANKVLLSKLCLELCKEDKDNWQIRIENNDVDIYTNDKRFYDHLIFEFKNNVTVQFEPDINSISVLENTNSIISKKYPHDKYHYKAYLLPHRIKDKSSKMSYLSWIESQGDKILISDAVKTWFINTDWNWDRRYIFVEDEKTLLMLKLRNPEVIGRVYDYVICDK